MPLVFMPFVIFPFVFSKLISFQVLIGLTFPAYLILAWVEPKYRPRFSLLYTAVGAYFIALLISVIFSVDPIRSWWGNQERMNGLFTLLHFFVWLTMTISVIKTWPQWRRLLNYQVGLGVFMAVVALLQKPFPRLLMFPAGERVGGLLDNPIYQGGYQIFILFFIALLWTKTKNNAWRAWYALAVITSLTSMMAAGSRGAFAGLLFGLILAAATVGILHQNKKIRLAVVGLILASGLFYGSIVMWGTQTKIFSTFQTHFPVASRIFDMNMGTEGRFIAWRIAWDGFLERPVAGWGLDNFHVLFNRKYNPHSLRAGYYETWFDRAHNTVMDVLSMTGLIGFITFVSIWILLYATVIYARIKKRIDLPTTAILIGLPGAYFLQNLFVFDHPAAFSMSYLLYALVIGIGFKTFVQTPSAVESEASSASEKPSPTNPVPWVAFGFLQFVFLLVIYLTSILPFYASMQTIKFNNAFSSGALTQSLEYARTASSIQTPYLDEQTYLYARSLMRLADSGKLSVWPQWEELFKITEDVNTRHLEKHGMNAHPRFIYASVLQSLARATQNTDFWNRAEEQLLAAIEESPTRQQLRFAYGNLLTTTGRKDEGLEQYRFAADLDPEIGEAWWYVAVSLYADHGKMEESAEYFDKAMAVSRPFQLKNVQDAYLVAEAYERLQKPEALQALILKLPTLPAAPADVYLRIAMIAERMEQITERDLILGAVIRLDPKTKEQLSALLDGRAQTITEALQIYQNSQQLVPEVSEPVVTAPEGSEGLEVKKEVQTSGPRL